MKQYKTDWLGRQTDPKMRKLEDELQILAGVFRGAYGRQEEQEEIAKEYRETMEKLYSLGWNGFLDMMSLIPPEHMPERYLKENPHHDNFREDMEQRLKAKDAQELAKIEAPPKRTHWLVRLWRK